MKNNLLYIIGFLLSAPAYGAAETPVMISEFYSRNIAPDGSVIASYTDASTSLYYTATGERVDYETFALGNGNCISYDGSVIVGCGERGEPVVLFKGKKADVSSIVNKYGEANFHGVSSDGRRIVGVVVNNVPNSETTFLPICVELDENGNLGDITLLPYTKKDWQGLDVQYCNACCISTDGKTILGQVVDWSGMDIYPILYTQDADGNWSYTLPTESYINPLKLPLPEYPGEFVMNPPYYADYMTSDELADYEEAMQKFWAGIGDEPLPQDFMSADNAAKYVAAIVAFNTAAEEYNAKVEKYFEDIWAIEESSIFFTRGSYSLSPDGKMMALAAEKIEYSDDAYDEEPQVVYPTYLMEVGTTQLREVEERADGLYPLPTSILSDGTVIAATSLTASQPPQTFVIPSGENEYVAIEEYLESKIPTAATWMKDNLVHEVEVGYDPDTFDPIYGELLMSGYGVVSDNWGIISGGLLAYLYPSEYSYESYLIFDDGSGIRSIDSDSESVSVKYYDLNGLEVKNPEKGIYIERRMQSDGSFVTVKKAV